MCQDYVLVLSSIVTFCSRDKIRILSLLLSHTFLRPSYDNNWYTDKYSYLVSCQLRTLQPPSANHVKSLVVVLGIIMARSTIMLIVVDVITPSELSHIVRSSRKQKAMAVGNSTLDQNDHNTSIYC